MSAPRSYQLYLHLSAEQRVRFKKFVHSPYYNTRTKLQKLVDYWEVITEGEDAWQAGDAALKILGNSKDLIPLNNLLSDIYRLLEDFLIAETVKGDPEWRVAGLARALEELGSSRATKAFLRRQERSQPDDPFALHYVNRLADQHHFSLSRQHNNADLLQSQQQLTIFYLTRQLKTWCELLNRNNILSLTYDEKALSHFQLVIEGARDMLEANPVAGLYYALFKWLKEPESDTWYEQLSPNLFPMLDQAGNADAKEVCAYLQNYFVRRINEGQSYFLQELYNLFQYMLTTELVLEGSAISQWTYKNIVTVGLRLRYFEATEEFIHNWYNRLPETDRDNAYHYNLAALHYESGQHDKALKLLQRVQFNDPVYYLDSHSILLKIYWEEGDHEAIRSLCESVRIYLLRQRNLNRQQIQLYRHLFRFTLRLFRLRYTSAHLTKQEQQRQYFKVKADIDQQDQVANRKWLLEQWQQTKVHLKFGETGG